MVAQENVEAARAADLAQKIVGLLVSETVEMRQRIVRAAMLLLGDGSTKGSGEGAKNDDVGGVADVGPRARLWLKQNGLTENDLQQVFHITEEGAELIASEVPGKNDKERAHSVYVLFGIGRLLATDVATFDDKAASAVCKSVGCYSKGNHARYIKDIGNLLTGSSNKGWTLTAPGLKQGAVLMRSISAKEDA
jgi:hypothetical protein